MGMKIYMIGLYSWISIVYYFIYCEERSYNGVMAMFWGVMAIIWIWDTITGYTTFERTHKYDLLSYVLLAMPFIYPMVSLARGLSFPEMTSPVMPCSVVVFTIGLLLLFAHKVNMFLVLFLNNLHADTKPKAKYINWLLITVCIGLAILLTTTMFLELVPKN